MLSFLSKIYIYMKFAKTFCENEKKHTKYKKKTKRYKTSKEFTLSLFDISKEKEKNFLFINCFLK